MDDIISRKAAIAELDHAAWGKEYDKALAKAMLESLPSAQQWIPCEERLPEPKKAVLGYVPRWNNIFALYYDLKRGWMVWSPIRDDCFPNMYGDIVAWMPMPDPYEEKQI